ncbi:MAG: Holliday junction resolvase RuvX [Gammaproteobacteria bacterium]|nr:Holliday junction resolvase RuvX [Gammaproteobacteria bacterium]
MLLAFDYGTRRIGVAVGQTTTGTASPAGIIHVGQSPDWAALERSVREWSPTRLVVGLPYNMDGTETVLTGACRAFAGELTRRFGLPVELVDERLTSAAAQAELRDARRSGARARRVRPEDVDANAARLILETWLRGHAT